VTHGIRRRPAKRLLPDLGLSGTAHEHRAARDGHCEFGKRAHNPLLWELIGRAVLDDPGDPPAGSKSMIGLQRSFVHAMIAIFGIAKMKDETLL
jgi:hypothetical protein